MAQIKVGTRVQVTDAFGHSLPRRVARSEQPGVDFPVVWLVREEEWDAAQREGREPEATPWPANTVEATG